MTPRNSCRAIKVVLLGEGCVEKASEFLSKNTKNY